MYTTPATLGLYKNIITFRWIVQNISLFSGVTIAHILFSTFLGITFLFFALSSLVLAIVLATVKLIVTEKDIEIEHFSHIERAFLNIAEAEKALLNLYFSFPTVEFTRRDDTRIPIAQLKWY